MPNKIQIRRGVKSAMPQGSAGEPLWTIDTEELYISTGQSNVKIGGFSLYMGTDMTATTNDWPYSYVDCPEVKLGDMYLNTDRGFIYMCTTAGKGAAAMWTYQGCLAAVGNAKNHPTGLNSIAMGEENNASGKWSVAMGKSNTADYEAAISIGLNNKNGTARSVVMGNYNKTSGNDSVTIGHSCESSGYDSVAIGGFTKALGNYSVAMGDDTIANGPGSMAIGVLNSPNEETDLFTIGNGTHDEGTRSNAFRVTYDGAVYGKGAFNSTGADYSEMFEWSDGNPDNEDRRGLFAYVENNKIRLATSDDIDRTRLGIISAAPAIVGDNYDEDWCGKYMTDIFGQVLTRRVHHEAKYELVEKIDPETNEMITENICICSAYDTTEPILNPNYDPEQKYVSRAERPEYDRWSFIGKLVAVDDGTCVAGGYCCPSENGIATACTDSTKGFYVMERLDDTHIRVLMK